VTDAVEHGRLSSERLRELSPVVFAAAGDGDAVARTIVDRLADELADMANAIIRRLHLARRDPDVVLAGGVFEADDARFEARIGAGIHALVPGARVERLRAMPVSGAALLALDRLAADDLSGRVSATARVRAELGAWRPA
jgi:BadF/BadG/BcrA/BcrD ATPase family.